MKNIILTTAILVALITIFMGGGMGINNKKTETLRVEFEGEREGDKKQQIYTTPGFRVQTHTAVKNRGNLAAYVYIQITVPVIKSSDVVLEKGVRVKGGYVPVMEFEVEKPWVLVEEEISSCVLTQVYCYGDLRPLRPGETTEKLFNEWSVVNCRVVNGRTEKYRWSSIAALCPSTSITVSSIQTNIGKELTPEKVWRMIQ